nr:glycosyltransferase [Vibrio hepatarius]
MCELHVISQTPKYDLGGDVAENFYAKIACKFDYVPSIRNLSFNKYIRKLQRIKRSTFCSLLDKDARFIVEYAYKNGIRCVWFGYGNISYNLIKRVRELNSELFIVCDTDSVWSRFILREVPFENDPQRKELIKKLGSEKELEEKKLVDLSNIVTAVSEVDANYYRTLSCVKQKVKVFSNVVDIDDYDSNLKEVGDSKEKTIYLAGSFSPNSAMDKAARWFINDILPLIVLKIPEVHMNIVGSGSIETLADINNKNVSILGKVDSVLPYLSQAAVSVVPLMFESGTRFKILEAAACHIPTVSTTLGAEGLPIEDGVHLLLADTAQDFALHTIRVINEKELAKNMADACLNLVCEFNSVEALKLEAKSILKEVLDDSTGSL